MGLYKDNIIGSHCFIEREEYRAGNALFIYKVLDYEAEDGNLFVFLDDGHGSSTSAIRINEQDIYYLD